MKQIIFRNKKIFYKVEGKRKPVILIHGFAEDNNIWKYQIEELKKICLVIIPDLPGSGNSEMLENDISIEDCAEVIKAIVDIEINIQDEKTFTLIGHSMGGYVALAFAEKYPDLLNGLGLVHSTSYADDEAKKETRRKGIAFIKSNGVELFLKTTTPNLFSEKTKKENLCLLQDVIDMYKGFSAESLMQYYEAMIKRPNRSTVLGLFQKPVFFIMGKHDNAVLLQSSLEQCYLPAICHIHILENSGHMGMWEEATKTNSILKQFLLNV